MLWLRVAYTILLFDLSHSRTRARILTSLSRPRNYLLPLIHFGPTGPTSLIRYAQSRHCAAVAYNSSCPTVQKFLEIFRAAAVMYCLQFNLTLLAFISS
jgi:hypothetical protein